MKQLTLLTTCFFALLLFKISVGQNNPVNADMVVAADGSGDFETVQAAIDAAPSNSDRRTVIYIRRGLYNTEKLIVPANKINITLVGESREETVLSYHIYDCNGGKCPAEDAAKWTGDNIATSATLTILGNGFRAENMTIQNTAGPVGQAQAITVRADKCVFISVNFYGYQDTMYFWSDAKRSYFEGCLVVGRTDYIYGSGTVFFNSCEIRSWGGGWITAPSTGLNQPYGFVFNDCEITYATGSPRGGDDGNPVRLGRPWQNYPKVTWMGCDITEMIHPQGWGDTWNMTYAATSSDLHLFEYKNTGPGADMSQRAAWVGLRALTDSEALNYTVQKVLAGTDGWDPTAESPLVTNYNWVGGSSANNWLDPQNWNPAGVPATGESATVDGDFTAVAAGDTFAADLNLLNGAKLEITGNSTVTYIDVSNASIWSAANVKLNGKIATKDTLFISSENNLLLNASLSGIHPLVRSGSGKLVLNANNSNFQGIVVLNEGLTEAPVEGSLGKGNVEVKNGATLKIGNDNAFYPKSKLSVVTGSQLQLEATVTTSEFYIDGIMQNVGEYNAVTNPGLISGTGKVIVGRPKIFTFHRGDNGNWDNPAHFVPALLPETGETVIVEEEMETTSTIFTADIVLQGAGSLRLRGNHTASGTIRMKLGTNFKYNTSGTGMSITAPVQVEGDVYMIMESGSTTGSTLTLGGPVSGNGKITALNNGKGTINTGRLLLAADNSPFSGTWDLTRYSTKYPTTAGYISTIEGNCENAFGKGVINVSLGNKVILSHVRAAGDSLVVNLADQAKIVLNTDVSVKKFVLNGAPVAAGEYSAVTNPEIYEGVGKLVVAGSDTIPAEKKLPAFPGAEGYGKYTTGGRGGKVIYVTNLNDDNNPGSLRYALNQSGPRIILFKVSGTILLKSELKISKGDVTIAGQTAPGDGITLRDYPVYVEADNLIIRFMRFRMGDKQAQEDDALGGRFHKNIIIDHCSASWSTDECVSFYANENFTLQWTIISESLRNSVHEKGAHGYGGIWGGKYASFHHNLLAHHDSRNPRLGEPANDVYALTDLVDLRNNIIYNWQGNSCYGGEGMNVNIVNCYYKPGPATTKVERIVAIDKNKVEGSPIYGIWGKFFIDGNVMTGSQRATNDNWTYGVYNQFHSSNGTVTQAERDAMRLAAPHNPGEITTHTAEKAYEKILEFGGASLKRDAVDVRILHDLSTGTATYMNGGNGSVNGIIDTQDAVGGWPVLESLNAPADSDEDGMPDEWESANNLNPYDGGDAQLKSVDGLYPNIEVYINSLVTNIVEGQNEDGISTAVKDFGIGKSTDENIKMYFTNGGNQLFVSHSGVIENIRIYSVTGQMLLNKVANREETSLDSSFLDRGIYIVTIRDEKNGVFSKKVAKF